MSARCMLTIFLDVSRRKPEPPSSTLPRVVPSLLHRPILDYIEARVPGLHLWRHRVKGVATYHQTRGRIPRVSALTLGTPDGEAE